MDKSNVEELPNFGDITYSNHYKYFFSFYMSMELYTRNIQIVFHKVLYKFLRGGYEGKTLHQQKDYLQLVLLWWSGTKSSVSLRYACKLVQLWKRVWRPSKKKKKLKTELQYDPAIHFWVFTQRNLKY